MNVHFRLFFEFVAQRLLDEAEYELKNYAADHTTAESNNCFLKHI